MRAGLLFEADILEFKLEHQFSRRTNSNSRHISMLSTYSSRSASVIQPDVVIDIRSWRSDSAPLHDETAWRVAVRGLTYTDSTTTATNKTLLVQFNDPRWYLTSDLEYEFRSSSCFEHNAEYLQVAQERVREAQGLTVMLTQEVV